MPDELHRGDLQWNTGFSHREHHLPSLAGFGVAACGIDVVNPSCCRCATSAARRGPRWAARSARAAGATTSSAPSATMPPWRPTRSMASTGTSPGVLPLPLPASGGQQGGLHWVGLKRFLGKEVSSPLLKRSSVWKLWEKCSHFTGKLYCSGRESVWCLSL